MWKKRILAVLILALGAGVAFLVYWSEPKAHRDNIVHNSTLAKYPFKLGLDLSGGSHLVYKADISALESGDVADSMVSLREVIERRINYLGVAEPVIQIEESSISKEHRLIVDLPGITDTDEAIKAIGATPLLEFKTERPEGKEKDALVKAYQDAVEKAKQGINPTTNIADPYYINSKLTGRYLKRAMLQFDPTTGEPQVSLQFNDEGSKLFEEITKANVGKTVAIYLDGAPISTPVVNEAISGGLAQISGNFTPEKAKELVRSLNTGALPIPVSLISKQTIGPSLGASAVAAGEKAALYGFIIIALFLILWYRLPGVIAVFALSIYVAIILALFKLIPVTLTSAGIAGFIISIGIAVDANVLIFERMKEEIKVGRTVGDAIEAGFDRAWFSIRDSNISSIITAVILFWFGTSLIKGFALTFGLGVIISLFSAITVTRIFLRALSVGNGKAIRFLFSSGFSK